MQITIKNKLFWADIPKNFPNKIRESLTVWNPNICLGTGKGAAIEAYLNRLKKAEAKINDLPHNLRGKKLRDTRRALLSEIRQVRILIGYAQEAFAKAND